MARNLGTLTVDLIAKTGGFVSGLNKAERETKDKSAKISKNLKAIGAAATAVATAVATSVAILVNNVKNVSVEIDNLSRLAGSGTDEFQKLSAAASIYGIQQDKVADILKDTQDKIGDFLQTGGGPLADFFEKIAPKVGVTADQFARLSGPQALQLYVSSLEKANLTQSELTFYMEALASDSTLLIPLLQDQGKLYNELGNNAEKYGVILSDKVIRQSILLDRQLKTISQQADGFSKSLGSELIPTVSALADYFIHLSEQNSLVNKFVKNISDGFDILAIAAIGLTSTIENVARTIAGLFTAAGQAVTGEFENASNTIDEIIRKNEESVRKAEELISNIWNDVEPDTSGIETANDRITKSFENVAGTISNEKSKIAIDEFIKSIEIQAATLGKTKEEIDRYKLSLLGATEEQIKNVKAIQDQISEYERLEKSQNQIKEFTNNLKFQAETIGKSADETERYKLSLLGATEAQLANVKSLQDKILEHKKAIEAQREEQEVQNTLNQLYTEHQSIITGVDSATIQYNETIKELTMLLQAGKISQDEFDSASKRAAESITETTEYIANFGEEAAKSIQSNLADFLFDPFENGLKGLAESFAQTLQRMAADAAAAQIMQALFGSGSGSSSGGGFLGNIAGWASSFFGGGRANGGPVMAGGIYEVGEFDIPELLDIKDKQYVIPGNNGNITSLAGVGGGTQIFNITTPNPDAFRKSERQIKRSLRSNI